MKAFYTTNRMSPERYLQNKEYFDSSLIQLLEKQNKAIDNYKEKVEIYKATVFKLRAKITAQNHKIKDQKAIIGALSLAGKEKDLTIEEILQRLQEIEDSVNKDLEEVITRNERLEKENSELKDQLRKYKGKNLQAKTNSTNSSTPPSFDIYKANANSRKPTNLKRGAQPGHKAHISRQSDSPDRILKVMVKKAPTGAEKRIDETGTVYYAVQEIDAHFSTVVTETRYYIDPIKGKEVNEGLMKKYRINSVSYSDHFKSMVLYLSGKGIIALDRLCTMLNEMSEDKISLKAGTVASWYREFGEKSTESRKALLQFLLTCTILHVDETGMRVNGKQFWAHTITDGKNTYYLITDKRADKDEGPLALLEGFQNILIHDHFKPYYTSLPDAIHGECNAHILRYLKAGVDFNESIACGKMIALLNDSLKEKKKLIEESKDEMPEERLKEISGSYRKIIDEELERYRKDNPNIKKKYIPDYIKTLRRMREYEAEHLRFLYDFKVPFTNNPAESSIRFLKNKRKISGQFINKVSGNDYLCLLSVIQTATLNKDNVLETIEGILKNY